MHAQPTAKVPNRNKPTATRLSGTSGNKSYGQWWYGKRSRSGAAASTRKRALKAVDSTTKNAGNASALRVQFRRSAPNRDKTVVTFSMKYVPNNQGRWFSSTHSGGKKRDARAA